MTTRASAVFESLPATGNKKFQKGAPTPISLPLHDLSDMRLSELDLDDYQLVLVKRNSSRAVDVRSYLPLTLKNILTDGDRQEERLPVAKNRDILGFGEVRVDLLTIEVTRANRPIQLSAMEFKVLKFCMFNPNRVISRDELLNEVWGYNSYPCTRTVDNHILRLRQKLESDSSRPVHFVTARGFGYRFIPQTRFLVRLHNFSAAVEFGVEHAYLSLRDFSELIKFEGEDAMKLLSCRALNRERVQEFGTVAITVDDFRDHRDVWTIN